METKKQEEKKIQYIICRAAISKQPIMRINHARLAAFRKPFGLNTHHAN